MLQVDFEKNDRFRDFGQKWPIFFETAHQIYSKLGQNMGTVALNH